MISGPPSKTDHTLNIACPCSHVFKWHPISNEFLTCRWSPSRKETRWAFKSPRSLSKTSANWRRSCSRQTNGEKNWGEIMRNNFLIWRCDELEQQGRRVRSDTQTRVRSLLKVNFSPAMILKVNFFPWRWSRNFDVNTVELSHSSSRHGNSVLKYFRN